MIQWDLAVSQYELLHVLQSAIFGSVCLAQDRLSGERTVVKLSRKMNNAVRGNWAESPELEAAIYAKLKEEFRDEPGSENVLKALDIRSSDTQHCLVLEYAEKGDCFDLCKNGGLTTSQAKKYFVQAALGLQYLHRRGICHRDISPENLVVTQDDVCKICDFGQAQVLGQELFARGPTHTPGKPGYTAPEVRACQADADHYKADVFSLGVCLFVMLSGVPPFCEARPSDRRFSVIQRGDLAKLVRVWRLTSKIPAEAIDLLNGMLCPQESRLSLSQVLKHPFVSTEDALMTARLPAPPP